MPVACSPMPISHVCSTRQRPFFWGGLRLGPRAVSGWWAALGTQGVAPALPELETALPPTRVAHMAGPSLACSHVYNQALCKKALSVKFARSCSGVGLGSLPHWPGSYIFCNSAS
jgi:hypothetical protein